MNETMRNAFLFTGRVPAQRKCKPFAVSYNRVENIQGGVK